MMLATGNGYGYGYGYGNGDGREQSAATRLLTSDTDIKFYLCQLHTLKINKQLLEK